MVGTSGRQRVQNDPFLSYEIPQPPKEIFDSFSEIAEPWFTQIRINTIENHTLTQLRDTLLPKLISGEVRVKDAEKSLTEVL
jgi:type I restriction enzyme S subunit